MGEPGEDRKLAERYVPHVRFDRAEPFDIQGVGYTVYTAGPASGAAVQSVSSKLRIQMEPGESVIEYAFYYDFDIQHLYDLEHVFVKIDSEGRIVGVLGSFHGKFLNNLLEGETEWEGTHAILYVQPGKHAFMPAPHYFRLFPDRDKCCGEYAGQDGLLAAPMFEGRIFTEEAFDRQAEHYIKKKYAFVPAWEFSEEYPRLSKAEDLLMPWKELEELIVRRITEWKRRILKEKEREI